MKKQIYDLCIDFHKNLKEEITGQYISDSTLEISKDDMRIITLLNILEDIEY